MNKIHNYYKNYKLYIDTLYNESSESEVDSEFITGLFRLRDYIQEDWNSMDEMDKKKISGFDNLLIAKIAGDDAFDFHEIALNNNYSKETHWWYWLAIDPDVKKYAVAA